MSKNYSSSDDYPSWPVYSEEERKAVDEILQSGKVNYWTGDECKKFEKDYREHLGLKYAVALMNGSLGLELALYSIGINAGDDVIVPSRTFIATASSVVIRGGRPVFADIDPVSQNITVDTIKAVITPATKAIITVHLAGWPCDMEPIMALAHEKGIKVIEDCAQAHGAVYKGRNVGSIGDVSVFSFCQDKIISTGGEGGMLVTNDRETYEKAWSYKDHGKSLNTNKSSENEAGFTWPHKSIGSNYRMTEMQAAIGRIQLKKLAGWVEVRQRNAALLTKGFSRIDGLRVTVPGSDLKHSYYKYYAFVETGRLRPSWTTNQIIAGVNSGGISCSSGSCSEVYLEKSFQDLGFYPKNNHEIARQLGNTSIMFQVHPTLEETHIEKCIEVVTRVMKSAVL